MARQLIEKIKGKVVGILPRTPSFTPLFPLKTFFITLAALLLTLVIGIGIFQYFIAPPAQDTQLSGKIIAVAEMRKTIIDEPIKTIHEPTPDEAAKDHSEEDNHSSNEAHPLNPSDIPTPSEKATNEDTTDAPLEIEEAIEGLFEETTFGPLPIIRQSDGLKSFDAYKAPFKLAPTTKGVISLVLLDYGLSTKLSKAAFEILPAYSNFIASPYSENLQAKITAARTKRIEIWLGMPMEGHHNTLKESLGPDTILAGLAPKENVNRANKHLGRATGYVGVAFNATPPFPDGSPDLQTLMNGLSSKGLGIAQMDTKDHLIDSAAAQASAPFVGADILIDAEPNKTDIIAALSTAEKMALEDGSAVAVFNPNILTFSLIAEWQKSLGAKNIQLAPLSYSVHIAKVSQVKKPDQQAAPIEDHHDNKPAH